MKGDTRKSQVITFRIDDYEHVKLLTEAKKNQMSISEYIRDKIFKEEGDDKE